MRQKVTLLIARFSAVAAIVSEIIEIFKELHFFQEDPLSLINEAPIDSTDKLISRFSVAAATVSETFEIFKRIMPIIYD